MSFSPQDRRALPDGWSQHYDDRRGIWFYCQHDVNPPRISYVHPRDGLSPGVSNTTNGYNTPTFTAAPNVNHNIERYSGPLPMRQSYSRSSTSPSVVQTKSFAQQLYASSVATIPGRAPDPPPEPEPIPRSRDTSPPIPVTELPRALPNGTPSRSRPGTAGSASASNSATAATQLVTNVSSVNPSRRPSSHLHTLKIGQIVGYGDEPSLYGTAISSSNRQSFHPGKNTSFGGRIVSGPRAIGEGHNHTARPPIRRPATSPSNRSSTYSFAGLESVHERQASAPAIPYPSGSSSVPHSRHQSTYGSLPSLSVRGLSPQSTGQTESPISPVASSVSLSPQVERRPDITPAAPLRNPQRPISVISSSSYSSLPPPPPPLPSWTPRSDAPAALQLSRLSSPPIQANVAPPPTRVSQNPSQPPHENLTRQGISQTMSTPQIPAQPPLQNIALVPVRAQEASTSSSASGTEERERPRKLRKRGQPPQPSSSLPPPPVPILAPPPPVPAVPSTSDASPRLQPQRRPQTNPSDPSFRNSVFSLTSDTSSRADINRDRPRKLRKPASQQPPLPMPTLPVMVVPEETGMMLTPLSRAPTPPPPRELQTQIQPQPRHSATVPNPRTQERPTSGHASVYSGREAAMEREYIPTPPVTRHSSANAVPPVPTVSPAQTQTQNQANVPRHSSANVVSSEVSSIPQSRVQDLGSASRQPTENASVTAQVQTQSQVNVSRQYQTYPEFEYSSSMAAAAAAAATVSPTTTTTTTRTTTSLARSTTSATVPPYQDFGLPPPPAGAAPAYYAISQSPEQDPSMMNDQLGFEFEPLGDPYVPLYGDHVDGNSGGDGSGNRGGESPPRSAAPAYQLFSPQESVQEEEVSVPVEAANGAEYGGRSEEGQDLPRGAAPAYHDGFSQGLDEAEDGTSAVQENARYNSTDAPLPSPPPTAAPAYQDPLEQTGSPTSQSLGRRESALPPVPTSAAPAYQDPSLDDARHSQIPQTPPLQPRRGSANALPSPPTSAAPAYQVYNVGDERESGVSQTTSQDQRSRTLPATASAAPAYQDTQVTSRDTRYSHLPQQTTPLPPRRSSTDALPSVPNSAAPAYRDHSRHPELLETPPESEFGGEGSPPPPPEPVGAAPAYQQFHQSVGQGSGSSPRTQASPRTQYNSVPSPPMHARSSIQTPQSQHQSQPSTSPPHLEYSMNAPVYQYRGNAQSSAHVHQRPPAQRAQTQPTSISQSPQYDADAPLPPPPPVTSTAPAYAQQGQGYSHGASYVHERQTLHRAETQPANVVQERYYNPNASLPPPPPSTTSTAPNYGQQDQPNPQNTSHARQRPRAQTQPASAPQYDPNAPLPPPPPPISAAPAYAQRQQQPALPQTQQQQGQATSPPVFHRAQTAPAPAPRSSNNMGRTVLAGLGGAAVGLLGAAALNNVINGGNGGGIDPSSFDMSGLTDGINGIIGGGGGDGGMGGDSGGGGDSGMGDYSQFDPSQSGGDPSQFNGDPSQQTDPYFQQQDYGDPSQDPWNAGQDQGQQQQDQPDHHEQLHHLQHAAHFLAQHHHHATQGNQQGGGLLGGLFGKPQKPNKPQNAGGGFLGALFGRPSQVNVHQQHPQTQQYHPQIHHQQQQHPCAVSGHPGHPNVNGQNSAGLFHNQTGQYPNGGQQHNPHAGGYNQHPQNFGGRNQAPGAAQPQQSNMNPAVNRLVTAGAVSLGGMLLRNAMSS